MTVRKVIGWAMLAAPFVGMLVFAAVTLGPGKTLVIIGATVGLPLWAICGFRLIEGDA